jgi:hypothetical protein
MKTMVLSGDRNTPSKTFPVTGTRRCMGFAPRWNRMDRGGRWKSLDRIYRMNRMGFLNNALHPVNPVNPVLIKLDLIPPFAVFAIFCKNFFGSRSRRPDDRAGQ